ncbi:MAG TPA: hypothetical protein VGO30_26905 [Mycobacterium sp.]|jgi:hypothetical protein|nr:hypothetical protein [Mycobacterium sp.]
MGAVSVAFSETSSAQPDPAPPGPVATSEITTGETVPSAGETVIETTAPPTPTTTIAEPSITGPAPLPQEQQDAL